jgi:hypothetical protein
VYALHRKKNFFSSFLFKELIFSLSLSLIHCVLHHFHCQKELPEGCMNYLFQISIINRSVKKKCTRDQRNDVLEQARERETERAIVDNEAHYFPCRLFIHKE